MSITQLKDILEILSYIAIIFGIPFGLLQYIRTKRKEQLDREYETYNALDEKYIQYLELCLKHPDLDIFDIPDAKLSEFKEKQKKEELIAFTILFSIFERAYIMYYDQSTKIKEKQWRGWEGYIQKYCNRKNFIQALEISGEYFDVDFQKFMEDTIKKMRNKNMSFT